MDQNDQAAQGQNAAATGGPQQNLRPVVAPTAAPITSAGQQIQPLSEFLSHRVFTQGDKARGGLFTPMHSEQSVEIHMAQDSRETLSILTTCIAQIQVENDPYQICAHHCSILLCYLPELITEVRNAFTDIGVTVNVLATRAARAEAGIQMEPAKSGTESYVFFGQAVLVLFKNIQAVSYDNFMRQRTYALRAHAGVPSTAEMIICISLEKAQIIRSTLGSCYNLKKELVLWITSGSNGTTRGSAVCLYLSHILSWTEMAAIVFIYETLLVPRSAALKHINIQVEAKNLGEAMRAINATNYPAFFKLISPPSVTIVMERSRFPTLIALAKRLKAKNTVTANQFVSGAADASPFVAELEVIHNNYMRGRKVQTANVLAYLYSVDESTDITED